MKYLNGLPDYEALTPEEASAELKRLPDDGKAAEATCLEWGGELRHHLAAHQKHRARLTAIANAT